ncbi:hypothetical protein, partial [Aeromonas caviae]|uniref:hypothetical protein n=1 Tax=Aeromonas caviae TaxID=648 RepID=UPI002B45AACB
SMMKVLAVMTYFQISLPTHNWDSAFNFCMPGVAGMQILMWRKRVPIGSDREGVQAHLDELLTVF